MITWEPGQIILDEYLIEKEIGRGGMGRVWLVRSSSSGHFFAVKQTLLHEAKHRKAFLAELQTWIDLPEHPNLVPCRFFRTIEDDVLIFSEYVEGGSLKNWIDSRRLYEGDQRQSLERILDIAIQFAWGLHSIHEIGLVHQDVKPGNVLVSNGADAALQGLRVQVSDYGLARARARSSEQNVQANGGGSILLSSGGYTPAYCSPEQAKGLPITRNTDLWSWGVSLFEMFTGGVTWHSGNLAGAVLDQYVRDADDSSGNLSMPAELVDILRGCFQNDAAKRWANLGEVVVLLKTVYLSVLGKHYFRNLAKVEHTAKRRTNDGIEWTDPCLWLEVALRLAGQDPAESGEIIARHGQSRRGQAVADLAIFEEAKNIYQEVINSGQLDLGPHLAVLYREKARIHLALDDIPGALTELDQCIAIYRRLVDEERRLDLANELAGALMNKGVVLCGLGDLTGAVSLYGQSITIYRRLVDQEGRRDLSNELAKVLMNKANTLQLIGDLTGAVTLYDQCLTIYRRLVDQEGRRDLSNELAKVLMNKANAILRIGDLSSVLPLYDQCIAIRQKLIEKEGRRESKRDLAVVLMNKANALESMGDLAGALPMCDQCIAIYRRLVDEEGQSELANELAGALMNKGVVLWDLGDLTGAVTLYDQCLTIYRRLVDQEGRRDLSNELAKVLMNKANAMLRIGDFSSAMPLYDQCIAIRQRLIEKEGRRDLEGDLAMALMNKASVLWGLGDLMDAVPMYEQCINIYRRLIDKEGRWELASELAKAQVNKANVLWDLDDLAGALFLYDQCIAIRQNLIEQKGQRQLTHDLTRAIQNRADLVNSMKATRGSGSA